MHACAHVVFTKKITRSATRTIGNKNQLLVTGVAKHLLCVLLFKLSPPIQVKDSFFVLVGIVWLCCNNTAKQKILFIDNFYEFTNICSVSSGTFYFGCGTTCCCIVGKPWWKSLTPLRVKMEIVVIENPITPREPHQDISF